MAASADAVPSESYPDRASRRSAGARRRRARACRRSRRSGFRHTNLRELGVRAGMSGGAALFDAFTAASTTTGEARDFPAVQGTVVPVRAPALRHGVGPRARRVCACAIAGTRRGRRSDMAFRARLARLLRADPLASPARRRDALSGPNPRSRVPERSVALSTAWREARTGYPIVDAAMRQINATGYMHNRLRMIVASFLVKDLLVDWRLGERISPTR